MLLMLEYEGHMGIFEIKHLLTTAPASRRPYELVPVAAPLPPLTGLAFFVVLAGLIMFVYYSKIKRIIINRMEWRIDR